MTIGVRQYDVDTGSSKFNEYRDIRDGFHLYDLGFDAFSPENGLFLNFKGENLLRDDQSLDFGVGDYGNWKVVIDRNEIPHNLSNKAKTPYIEQGDGLLTLPSTVPIPNPDLVPTAGQLQANDAATADWLSTTLRKIDLGTQRDKTGANISLTPTEDFKFRLSLSDERKDGTDLTYGPIGDRPPRTLNVQLAEPIDYKTQELQLEAEYNQPTYQAMFTYLLSSFENDIDTLRWQNTYVADIDGSGYDTWDGAHNVASYGQRALSPDNSYQNAMLSLGVDLPMASRLSATAAYGMMRQDESLLPYSSTNFGSVTDFGSTSELPRDDADAEINTTLLNADYSINPIACLNLKAFARYYDLDNESPQDNWWYVTDDTITVANALSGETTELNKRINLAYSYDKLNYGLQSTYNFSFWRTNLGLGYKREDIDRDFREADTEENIFNGSVKTRPIKLLTVQAKYLYGDREGNDYNNTVTAQSYWDVDPASESPANSFSNHPDLRKFDVTDRERNQVDLSATVIPLEVLSITGSYRYRDDDYDSGVDPVQPLLASGTGVTAADDLAATPGDQLGLLETETNRYDSYKISDWMQEANTPWVESVGSEYLLRDTFDATSNQWGNRLISLGSYLGPGYEAHFGKFTLTYRF